MKRISNKNSLMTKEVEIADNNVRYVPTDKPFDFCSIAHESRYAWLIDKYELEEKSVLDFGCGSGYGAFMIGQKAKEVHAIDYSQKAIEYAKTFYSNNNIKYFVLDACSPHSVFNFLKSNAYDIVVSFDVIEHLERYFAYLENISRLLKENGFLVIGCPNRLQTFYWNREWNRFHFQEFTPYQLRKVLLLYFEEVTLISQDFRDENKKVLAQKKNIRSDTKNLNPLSKFFKKLVNSIHKRLSPAKRRAKLCKYEYSDINFISEPCDEVLNKAFGLIAVCKKPKTKVF